MSYLSGVFKLAMTFVSAILVENPNFGRRTLLLYGNTGSLNILLLVVALIDALPCRSDREPAAPVLLLPGGRSQ